MKAPTQTHHITAALPEHDPAKTASDMTLHAMLLDMVNLHQSPDAAQIGSLGCSCQICVTAHTGESFGYHIQKRHHQSIPGSSVYRQGMHTIHAILQRRHSHQGVAESARPRHGMGHVYLWPCQWRLAFVQCQQEAVRCHDNASLLPDIHLDVCIPSGVFLCTAAATSPVHAGNAITS